MKKIIKFVKDIRYKLPSRKFLFKISALLPGFILVSLRQIFKVMPKTDKKILFILDEPKLYSMGDGNSRNIYAILNKFSEAGYNVYFYKKINLKTYYHLEVLGRLIFSIKNLKILSRIPQDTSDMIFAFDRVDHGLLQRKWKKLVFVNVFKPPFCQVGPLVWIPYFMFPMIYHMGQHKLLGAYRQKDRKIRMMFAGNTSKTYYNNPKLKNRYGQLTRIEGMNALLEVGARVKIGESSEDFKELMNMKAYANECRVLLTNANFPIPCAEWLNLISISDFFICLSGTDMPICHNSVEAIAVGTIPIVSYQDWFFPPL